MKSMLHEGTSLTPDSRTLWEVQARTLRTPVETATNLYTDIQRRMAECLRRGAARRETVRDVESLARYRQKVRTAFLACIAGLPETSATLTACVAGRCTYDSYVLEKILLQPRPGAWAKTNLYLPVQREAPFPAVLLVVGHDDQGKADPAYQYAAQLLAHQGIAALVLDPQGQGEGFEHYEAEMAFQPIQGCSGEHDLLDWKAKLLGMSIARYFVHDGICAWIIWHPARRSTPLASPDRTLRRRFADLHAHAGCR